MSPLPFTFFTYGLKCNMSEAQVNYVSFSILRQQQRRPVEVSIRSQQYQAYSGYLDMYL